MILKEWKALLRATRKTIQYLIIDQRPCLESYAADQISISSSAFLRHYGCGKGWQAFERKILPVLLKGRWPELKVIHLHGFHVPDPRNADQERRFGPLDTSVLERERGIIDKLERKFGGGVKIISSVGQTVKFEEDYGTLTLLE